MGWRCRDFEYVSYRPLILEYWDKGAAAPKPLRNGDLYDNSYPLHDLEQRNKLAAEGKYVTTESEPVFDSADIMRCGIDIFVQRSHVTNNKGIHWLRSHLGERYNVHTVNCINDPYAMHIDITLFPLKPGIVLVCPARSCIQIEMFQKAGWKVLEAPQSVVEPSPLLPVWDVGASDWLNMNVIMLDEDRVIVERDELPTHKLFESIGLKCIKVPFRRAFVLGGGFHCYTAEIRRRGQLQSYF